MSMLNYHNNTLHMDNVSLEKIADDFGTPCYIYSRAVLEKNWYAFSNSLKNLPHRICYAVKANSNLAILNILDQLGAHFDIVSGGELQRVLLAGAKAEKIIFSGVGKSAAEIAMAIDANIHCFDVESASELERINHIAKEKNKRVSVCLRVNPNINADTHPYISTGLKENKFGIEYDKIMPLCEKIQTLPQLNLIGLAAHIGSQITTMTPFLETISALLALIELLKAKNMSIEHLNIGGGLGICYDKETPPSVAEYCQSVIEALKHTSVEIILEPGRALIAEAGVLLTRIEYLKETPHTHFTIVDAGMNDLIRPALYHAFQPILPVTKRDEKKICYDIVGPVCESADFLGKNRELAIKQGDLLIVDKAGAYGFCMTSNYNSRMRPAEIMISNGGTHLIRKRETMSDLTGLENIIME